MIAEAIWTRYLPMSRTINEIIDSGAIGNIRLLTADLGYIVTHKERIVDPALAGGALFNVGVYPGPCFTRIGINHEILFYLYLH